MNLEEVAAELICGGLEIVLSVVRPGGWGQCSCRSGWLSPGKCNEKASGEANRRGRTGCCHDVGVGERRVRAKTRQSKSAQRLAGLPHAAVAGRPDGHLDARWSFAVGS
jgi:hypothetical protein